MEEIYEDDIELYHHCGSGGFSEVFLGLWKGKRVAVKFLTEVYI